MSRDANRRDSPSPQTAYTWDINGGLPLLLQDKSAAYIYGPGGMLLEQVAPPSPLGASQAYFYHTDQLGSIRALTNSSGSVVNTYDYDAYGNVTSQTGTRYNPFGYTGEYTDSESGLVYLRARYYDPSTQQFLTVDPIVAWTEQAYAYAAGNPVYFTDPTGLDNLTEKCKALARKIANVEFKVERAERNLDRNIGGWDDADPRRVSHQQDLEDYRENLRRLQERYTKECSGHGPGSQPVPVPMPVPVPVPTPQPSSQPQAIAVLPSTPPVVAVPGPRPIGVGTSSDNGVCDAIGKTVAVTAGAVGTAVIIDWLLGGLAILVLVAP